MSCKLYDFTCLTCNYTKEFRVWNSDTYNGTESEIDRDDLCCLHCLQPMHRDMPAPKGYVSGTQTPVYFTKK